MEARRMILCCVASASVSALLAATATAAAIRVEVGQRSVPPAPGSAAVQQEAEKYAYILGNMGAGWRFTVLESRSRPRCWMSIWGCCRRQMPRPSGRGSRWRTAQNWSGDWKILSAEGLSSDCNRFFIKKG